MCVNIYMLMFKVNSYVSDFQKKFRDCRCKHDEDTLLFHAIMATGWTIGVLGFDSRGGGLEISLFTTASRPALGPTHLSSNEYQGLFPWG
jgi:hypothetical protein